MDVTVVGDKTAACVAGVTFGGPATGGSSSGGGTTDASMWASGGCQAVFRCAGVQLLCPIRLPAVAKNISCACTSASHSNDAGTTVREWEGCPRDGNLEDQRALANLVKARQSPQHDLVVLLYGLAGGSTAQLSLGEERGLRFLQAQIASLKHHASGREHYLVATPHLAIANHPADNVCASSLRPRGICCGWSRAGMAFYDAWKLGPTHPFVLFALRHWVVGEVLRLGTNALYVDLDLHLGYDALRLFRTPALRGFGVLWHGDEGWPVREGTRTSETIGPGESLVVCSGAESGGAAATDADLVPPSPPPQAPPPQAPSSSSSDARQRARRRPPHPRVHPLTRRCVCGVTAAPKVNTGLFYARASPETADLFRDIARRVHARLSGELMPPGAEQRGSGGGGSSAAPRRVSEAAYYARIQEQEVANELVYRAARLPSWWRGGAAPSCHPWDVDCGEFGPARRHPNGFPARWWVDDGKRNSSVWLASPLHTETATEASGVPGPSSSAGATCGGGGDDLLAITELEGGVATAVLPQSVVGRVCGKRKVNVTQAIAPGTRALECGRLHHDRLAARAAPLVVGQRMHHLQVVNRFTSEWVFDALGWWAEPRPHPDMGHRASAACTEASVEGTLGVLIGSKTANYSLICAPPAPHAIATNSSSTSAEDGGSAAAAAACPCCWRASDAVAGALTSRCRVWNTAM